ncbi:hypothetical protein HB793_02320 [Listeria welshimeri]|nr:hypothetical protein [Listeria welshimeri]
MKQVINDTLSVFGIVFIVLIIGSYFFPIGEIINDARSFLIFFFLVNILGKYLLNQKREKNKQ